MKIILENERFFTELLAMDFFTKGGCMEVWQELKWRRGLKQGAIVLGALLDADILEGNMEALTDKQKNFLLSALEYLSEAFGSVQKNFLPEQMPLLLCLAEEAQNEEMDPHEFCKWWMKKGTEET